MLAMLGARKGIEQLSCVPGWTLRLHKFANGWPPLDWGGNLALHVICTPFPLVLKRYQPDWPACAKSSAKKKQKKTRTRIIRDFLVLILVYLLPQISTPGPRKLQRSQLLGPAERPLSPRRRCICSGGCDARYARAAKKMTAAVDCGVVAGVGR